MHVVVVELLAPQHARERLALDAAALEVVHVALDEVVEGVGLVRYKSKQV